MPTEADLSHAIGCLSTVFPQFVANELATLMDQITAGVQGFTDPLGAAANLNLDSLIDKAASLSSTDAFAAAGNVAVGLMSQHVRREVSAVARSMAQEFPGVTKRIHEIRNSGEQIISTAYLMIGLAADMPYIAARKMCATIIKSADLKLANLDCMKKHITQLSNAIVVLAKSVESYKDDTITDLGEISTRLATALDELAASQRVSGNQILFDTAAFDRARDALLEVSAIMSPDNGGTSIMDVADILAYGSVDAAHVSRSNQALATIVIPSLIALIDAEIAAVSAHAEVINQMVIALSQTVASYRASANTSLVQAQRARGIFEIKERITDLRLRVDLAIRRSSTRAASAEMLFWTSRVKAMIAFMDQLKELEFTEGSVEDVGRTTLLQNDFNALLAELGGISSGDGATVLGIEDTTVLRTKVTGLTKGALRIRDDIDTRRVTPNRIATFHALAAQSAGDQISTIDESAIVASRQKAACLKFLETSIDAEPDFDQLVDSMRQVGYDRGADLLSSGQFARFLDTGANAMSYLGTVIKCLGDTINGLDDAQTKQQLGAIRSGLVARQVNQEIAAADSSDQGISRYVDSLQTKITEMQKQAKTAEAILGDLKEIAKQLGVNISAAADGLDAFSANVDRLAVSAGGRLSGSLEEFSKSPKAGVPLCDAP